MAKPLKLVPGERRRVTPTEAQQLIRAGTGTISVRTCFGSHVLTTKKAACDLLAKITDETVALSRADNAAYYFLFLAA